MRLHLVLSTALLALPACGSVEADSVQSNGAGADLATPAPVPADISNANEAAASEGKVLRTETVSGTFTGWDMGDYLWAQIAVPGREPVSAIVEDPVPNGLFLDANVGQRVTVEIETALMHVPEAGGEMEMRRISAARNAAGTAESWWQSLPAADRAAAQRRLEEGALSSGGGS